MGFKLKIGILHNTPLLPCIAKLDELVRTSKNNIPARATFNLARMCRQLTAIAKNEVGPEFLALIKKYAQLEENGELKKVMSAEIKDKDGKVIAESRPTGDIHLIKETKEEFHKKADEFFEVETNEIASHKISIDLFDMLDIPQEEKAELISGMEPVIEE